MFCCLKQSLYLRLPFSYSPSCPSTHYVTVDDLKLLISLLPPPEFWVADLHYHTHFMQCWRWKPGLHTFNGSALPTELYSQPMKTEIAGLALSTIILPQPPKYWDYKYRHKSPYPTVVLCIEFRVLYIVGGTFPLSYAPSSLIFCYCMTGLY